MTQKAYHHLQGLELVNQSKVNFNSDIKLLMAANMMWQCFTGEMRRNDENIGPVALNTHFGWVLSGTGNMNEYLSK